ncbi:TOM7 family domain-containing protein [Ditylenchus destructor]|nr:TOM7 family domain-containing protein [Ditylenchus destructor]
MNVIQSVSAIDKYLLCYHVVNGLSSLSFIASKLFKPICHRMYGDEFESCVFNSREHELLVFIGVIIVFKNRKSLNWRHYLSTIYFYSKFANAFFFFRISAIYGILYSLFAIATYVIFPEPVQVDSDKIVYFRTGELQREMDNDKSVVWVIEFFNTWSAECRHVAPATDADDETEIDQSVDLVAIYKRLLELLTGKETIAAALKRMNSEKGLSAAEERKRRWAAKKAGTKAVKSDKPEAVDDSYDMFGDEPVPEGPSQSTADPDQVMWEYKLKSDDSKLIGPFTTVDMISKSESDALKEGAFVSERTKKVIEFSVETFRFGVQWGFVPFIVYLGFRRGAEPGPNGEIVPLSIANMFYG